MEQFIVFPYVPKWYAVKLVDMSTEKNEVESHTQNRPISIKHLHVQMNLNVGNFYPGF